MNIPLFEVFWDEEDIEAVTKVIRSGKYWCIGKEIADFEQQIADYLGIKHCVAFNSGGSALFATMKAYGIKERDEIIVPSFTFIATAYAPMYFGGTPVFADIESQTFGLDPEDVKKKITPKTRGIMPIHYGGRACKIDELVEVADSHDIPLIEDAAQSFGAKYKDKFVGTFGHSAIFSFCQNKVFTTSEGGCVVTDDSDFYEKLKLFRSYGRVVSGDYFVNIDSIDYVDVGHNIRMSTILAALGSSQLGRVDTSIKRRREHAQYMTNQLEDIKEIITPKPPTDQYYQVYQMYSILVKDGQEKRDKLLQFLTEKGIASRVYFDPIHRYSVFKDIVTNELQLPKTDMISKQILTLPLFATMTKDQIDYIVETIRTFFS